MSRSRQNSSSKNRSVARRALVCESLESRQLMAIDVQLAANVAPASDLVEMNGDIYFSATDANGTELWRFDGTTASRVADINPGPGSSSPRQLTNVGGVLYFSADDGTTGRELWQFDGSTASQVADIRTGTNGSYPSSLTNFGGTLVFSANNGVSGAEIWATTPFGVKQFADILPGPQGSYPNGFTEVSGTLFFEARQSPTDYELWRFNGTTTSLVADLRPGTEGSRPGDLTNVNGTLFFSANNGTSGYELFSSNGTTISLVSDIAPGIASSFPGDFTNINNTLFFTADNGVTGTELWRATSAGAQLVADINPGTIGSYPAYFTNVGGVVYFSANDGSTGTELWKTTGTGASRVSDIRSGARGSMDGFEGYHPTLVNFNGAVLFGANNGSSGYELWRADASGAKQVIDLNRGAGSSYPGSNYPGGNFLNLGGVVYFRADSGTGDQLWRASLANPTVSTNTGSTAREGMIDGIGPRELTATAPNTRAADITFTVTRSPVNGRLELSTAPGVAITSFTQADINAGRVRYVHDGSETRADSFTFDVTDDFQGVLRNQTFRITVTPVNDAPTLKNLGISVREGHEWEITFKELQATDPDNRPLQLVYTITTRPTHGRLFLETNPTAPLTTLTQADINSCRFIYLHDGSETTSDSFQFTLSDGAGGVLRNQTFNIRVIPVNDPATITNTDSNFNYQRGTAPKAIAPNATVNDPDNVNFAGGYLLISITSGRDARNDLLSIGGPFVVTGANVRLNGVLIGTIAAGTGISGKDLRINLTRNATIAVTQQLARAIQFSTASYGALGQRDFDFKIYDGYVASA